MSEQRDPLADQREKINSGAKTRLVWEDAGESCPVKTGDVFELRSCSIEITRTHRSQSEGKVRWEAEFTRYQKGGDRVHILGASSGYTSSAMGAMKAQDDPDAATLVRLDSPNLGPEPEPEAVPPQEVAMLPSTVAAKHNFESLRRSVEQERRAQQLSAKLRNLQKRAQKGGVDLGDELNEVENLLLRVEKGLSRVA